jgi:hypothetical protein
VIGVYNTQESLVKYTLAAYSDIMHLSENMPVTGFVQQGQYNYYVFKADCAKCALLIAVSTISTGNPDMYVTYGEQRVPSKEDYDFKSETFKNEVLELDITNAFYTDKRIKSMEGNYFIAIYGSKNSSYTISIAQETQSMAYLIEERPLKKT